jgi:hypothetical protein
MLYNFKNVTSDIKQQTDKNKKKNVTNKGFACLVRKNRMHLQETTK